jgi:hypothetical protein
MSPPLLRWSKRCQTRRNETNLSSGGRHGFDLRREAEAGETAEEAFGLLFAGLLAALGAALAL